MEKGKDFKRGEAVEISIKEEGFSGSYYSAIVLARVGKDHFLVEYKTLCSDDGLRMLREIVPCTNVRHFPPEIKVTGFSVLDKVDAYDNDGWWVGTITSSKGRSEYCVYFETSGEQVTYPLSKLRVHQEWENEKWVISNIKALKNA